MGFNIFFESKMLDDFYKIESFVVEYGVVLVVLLLRLVVQDDIFFLRRIKFKLKQYFFINNRDV